MGQPRPYSLARASRAPGGPAIPAGQPAAGKPAPDADTLAPVLRKRLMWDRLPTSI